MRRRAGIGAIQKQKLEQDKYKDKGTEIQENQVAQMATQMSVLRTNLEEFATKYKNEIKKDPQFRKQFQEMCASIGVDPLASAKGFWAALGIGDFYYELAVQIVEVCLATNYKTGGLIGLGELRERLIRARGKAKKHQEISENDLLCAVRKLKVLGSGFTAVSVGNGQFMVQSVPGELSMEHTAVLQQVANSLLGFTSVGLLRDTLGWERDRAQKALDYMIEQGLAWLDLQDPQDKLYYFPSLFTGCVDSSS